MPGAEHIKIADVYAEQGEHKLAMEHYRKSLALRQDGSAVILQARPYRAPPRAGEDRDPGASARGAAR